MNRIDRLIASARRARGGVGRYILGFVEYDPAKGLYTASCTVWDGVKGSQGIHTHSEHKTQEEAVSACESIAAQHHGLKDVNILVNDIAFMEW